MTQSGQSHSTSGDVCGLDCPLCLSPRIHYFFKDARRSYFQCGNCRYIFADPASLPEPLREKARYDRHRNSPSDEGYRRFLSRLADPLCRRLGPKSRHGLDFGCGPGPVLPLMMEERGHSMSYYDPFYTPDPDVLERQYGFVTCTEAMEHFHRPAREWDILMSLLAPSAWLGIMTSLARDRAHFENWYYKEDFTHVGFFSRETFLHLARRDNLSCEFIRDNVILLQRRG